MRRRFGPRSTVPDNVDVKQISEALDSLNDKPERPLPRIHRQKFEEPTHQLTVIHNLGTTDFRTVIRDRYDSVIDMSMFIECTPDQIVITFGWTEPGSRTLTLPNRPELNRLFPINVMVIA